MHSNRRSTPRRSTPLYRNLAACVAFFVLWLSTAGTATGKEKLSGYVAVQAGTKDGVSAGVDATAEVKYKTRRVEGTRAVISIEGSYYDRTLLLEDLYLDHKPSDDYKLTLGISKKILGLEYEWNKPERTTIRRSPIYQKMERLGIVGRQLNLRLLAPASGRKDEPELSGALGVDGSYDMNLQFSLLRSWGSFGVGTWMLAEAHKVSSQYEPMMAEAVALWGARAGTRATLELFHGLDTQRTEFQRTLGDHRRAMFFGSKLELLHTFRLGRELALIPIVQSSFWLDDATRKSNNSLQLLAGVRLQRGPLALSVNLDTTGVRRGHGERHFNQGALYAEALFTY